MNEETAQFITIFQNLPGNTIGEKRKNIFLSLQNPSLNHEVLIASLIPTTYLQKSLKLEILLRLQRFSELIDVLKNEEEILTKKLLANKWFCQKLAAVLDENSTGFVNNILPCLSLVMRMRILNELALFGTKLDTLFDEVCAQYGIFIASKVLLGCTEHKVEDVLTHHKIILPPSHEKILFDKYPRLLLEYMRQNCSYHIEEHVMHHVALKDMDTFTSLTKERVVYANLGKRLTRKLLTNFKQLAIANADNFSMSLHPKTTIKVLGKDFSQFYFNCFPSSNNNFIGSTGFYKIRDKLGKQYYKLLLEGFEKKYNANLYNFPGLVNEEMMEQMDVEDREKWIEIKKQKGVPEMNLVKFMRTSKSIPIIKAKINVTSSVNARGELLNRLLSTCKINNDFEALAEVLEYVCSRHRNEEKFVLSDFLYKLQFHLSLKQLNERHWKSINLLLKIINTKEYDFLREYIHFLYNRNQLDDEQLRNFLKMVKEGNKSYYDIDSTIDDTVFKKHILLKFIEFMPDLMDKDEQVHHFDMSLITWIIKWNKFHQKDSIAVQNYPRLMESLRKSIVDAINLSEYIDRLQNLKVIFQFIICSRENSDFRNEMIKAYFTVGFRFYNLEIDLWLLKFQPAIIDVNFDKFFDHLTDSYQPDVQILNYLKKYENLSFRERTINHCLEELKKNNVQGKVLIILAFLTPAEEFLHHISPYYPSEEKFDFDDEESRKRGENAIHVATSFKYSNSALVLPTLILYCKGDLLRYCLESLYYLFYHLPENKLSSFILDLSSKAVSVRKHSIFLTCAVGNVNDVKQLLTRFMENERNISVQKHLFTAALKYFVKNPSDEFFECVKTCMTKLDKQDSESFSMLLDLEQIPNKYQADHVMFVWNILMKNEDLDKNRPRLLSSIPKEIFKNFPLNFLLEIITNNFLVQESKCNNALNDFVINCLTNTDHKTEVLNVIFEIFSRFQSATYESLPQEATSRRMITWFIEKFINAVERNEDNFDILYSFSKRCNEVFKVTEFFEEHLMISLFTLYVDCSKDVSKYKDAIIEYFRNLVTTYGIVVVDTFASVLKGRMEKIFGCFGDHSEEYYRFCLDLMKSEDFKINLLVINMLPNKEPDQDKPKKCFYEIINGLRQVSNEAVQVVLSYYIKSIAD